MTDLCVVAECSKPRRKRGLCYMHYSRQFRYGDLTRTRPTTAELFWPRVEKTTTCWNWTGTVSNWGYGRVCIGGRTTGAHRAAYEMLIGKVASDLHLDHLCRNRRCVNPEHLEPVTPRVNILRGEGLPAKQARVTHCPRGHPYIGSNLYINPKGARECRECGRTRSRTYARSQRAKRHAVPTHDKNPPGY